MTNNYCVINPNNIVENVCVWNGVPQGSDIPPGYTMVPQATTIAKIWGMSRTTGELILVEEIGQGQIGYTWDGKYLITNEPKPQAPQPLGASPDQPNTLGTQTL